MPFRDRARDLEQRILGVSLNILIWGPGPGRAGYDKCLEIRDALRAYFTASAVMMSEELTDVPESTELSQSERELWHLASADVCIVLSNTPGSDYEVAQFVNSPMSHKLLVLNPDHLKGLWQPTLRRSGIYMFYTPEEYASSALIERVIARVKQIALGKLLKLTV